MRRWPAGILRVLRHSPSLTLMAVLASGWLWTWAVRSELSWSVHRACSTWLAAGVVVLAAVATAAVAKQRPRLVALVFVTSPVVVMPARWATTAAHEFATGQAQVWVGGFPGMSPPYGSIDEQSRIPLRGYGCLGAPWHAPIHNAVLSALHRTVGPMPGVYWGPLPTAEAAESALDERGTVLEAACDNHILILDGHRFAFDPKGDPVCGAPDAQARVVLLNGELIAVERRRHEGAPCGAPSAQCRVDVYHPESRTWLGRPPSSRDLAEAWARRDRRRRGLPEHQGLSGFIED